MSIVVTENAPSAVGPYSQARTHGGLLFVSGQLLIDPATGAIVSQDPLDQLAQCISNVEAIAIAAGTSLSATLKTTVLVTDISRFGELNRVYAERFSAPFPARAAYEVAALPMSAQVEVEAIIALD